MMIFLFKYFARDDSAEYQQKYVGALDWVVTELVMREVLLRIAGCYW
jgi:hypothetical protein